MRFHCFHLWDTMFAMRHNNHQVLHCALCLCCFGVSAAPIFLVSALNCMHTSSQSWLGPVDVFFAWHQNGSAYGMLHLKINAWLRSPSKLWGTFTFVATQAVDDNSRLEHSKLCAESGHPGNVTGERWWSHSMHHLEWNHRASGPFQSKHQRAGRDYQRGQRNLASATDNNAASATASRSNTSVSCKMCLSTRKQGTALSCLYMTYLKSCCCKFACLQGHLWETVVLDRPSTMVMQHIHQLAMVDIWFFGLSINDDCCRVTTWATQALEMQVGKKNSPRVQWLGRWLACQHKQPSLGCLPINSVSFMSQTQCWEHDNMQDNYWNHLLWESSCMQSTAWYSPDIGIHHTPMADLRALCLSHDQQHTQPQTIQLQYSFICSALSLIAMYLETSTRIATHHWPNSFATYFDRLSDVWWSRHFTGLSDQCSLGNLSPIINPRPLIKAQAWLQKVKTL